MKYLKGFRDCLDTYYDDCILQNAYEQQDYWTFHLHGQQQISAKVTQNLIYEVELTDQNQSTRMVPKTQIKFLYPFDLTSTVEKMVKYDQKVKKLKLEPIIAARPRHHVKNKSLYVLMKERQVVFFTLLEGEIIRGLIAKFARYNITVNLKGGKPVTLMRHSVYDLRDKKKRCFLKAFQEIHRDWKKSAFYKTLEQ